MQRRNFLKNSILTGAGIGFAGTFPSIVQAAPLQETPVGIALIGCKGMGWSNLMSMLKVNGTRCVALCDVDDNVLSQRMDELKKKNIVPKTYKDYREVLASPEVQAVIIATPDHWHCLMMVDACKAGKEIYVEKPAANSVAETITMVEAAKKYDRIVQVNQWQRSQQHFQDAIAYVHSGKLGNIYSVKTWFFRGGGEPLTPVPDGPVPEGVDYNMWLGPAPKRPFNQNRFHYQFRWFWDYAGGLMTDWGVHLFDIALWGMNAGDPVSVASSGAKYMFPTDAKETPDLQTALYDYGSFQLTWEHSMGKGQSFGYNHGIAFIGSNATLIVNRSGWEVIPEKDKKDIAAVPWTKRSDDGLDMHTINFIKAVRAKNKDLLNCPIEAGARVAAHCHLGNISLRSKEKVFWDKERQSVTSKKARKLLKPKYENGWKYPQV